MAKLTAKQRRFVEEYLIDLNATQAAIRAGYSPNGMNKRITRMMANEGIQEEIQNRIKKREQRTEITQDMVVQELAAIAFARATDYAMVKGGVVRINNTEDLSENQIRAIAGIKEGANGIEVKLNDKEKALELLGRHLGMWNDKLNVGIQSIDGSIKEMEDYLEQRKKEGS